MKLRCKGNSLRLRVSRSEVERFLGGAGIEEAVHFSADPAATLIYALKHAAHGAATGVVFADARIAVSVSEGDLRRFAQAEQVGIYASLDIGSEGQFELVIEKDFACLDRSDEDNQDTFPNPHMVGDCGTGR